MSKLTIELDLSEDAAVIHGKQLIIDLGHGVTLKTDCPPWVERINKCHLEVVMDVEGSPNAKPNQTSVQRVHKTPPDGGQ